jgi:hypothetical protein
MLWLSGAKCSSRHYDRALTNMTLVWCDTCGKTRPMIFDVMGADDKNDHDAVDIVCAECKSVVATLHARRTGVSTNNAVHASEMAAQELDRLIDPSAPDEERQRRKRRLLMGPKEFRDIRGKR